MSRYRQSTEYKQVATKHRIHAGCYTGCYKAQNTSMMLHELLQTKHRTQKRCYMSYYRLNTEWKQDVT